MLRRIDGSRAARLADRTPLGPRHLLELLLSRDRGRQLLLPARIRVQRRDEPHHRRQAAQIGQRPAGRERRLKPLSREPAEHHAIRRSQVPTSRARRRQLSRSGVLAIGPQLHHLRDELAEHIFARRGCSLRHRQHDQGAEDHLADDTPVAPEPICELSGRACEHATTI
jgi:hypothetical protein